MFTANEYIKANNINIDGLHLSDDEDHILGVQYALEVPSLGTDYEASEHKLCEFIENWDEFKRMIHPDCIYAIAVDEKWEKAEFLYEGNSSDEPELVSLVIKSCDGDEDLINITKFYKGNELLDIINDKIKDLREEYDEIFRN